MLKPRPNEQRAAARYRAEKSNGSTREAVVRPTPTVEGLLAIPLATMGEFELREDEIARFRRLAYGINKDGIRRYRTMRDGSLLMVWRIK